MSQSPTKLVKDALESKVREVESASREASDARSSGTATITRADLEAAVREGVQEGLSEYQRTAEQNDAIHVGGDDHAEGHYDEDESSGGSGLRTLVLLGLVVAAVLYARRRSGSDDSATDY